NGNPVNDELERAAPLVEMAVEDDRAQTRGHGAIVEVARGRRRGHVSCEVVARLIAISRRPPELRLMDFNRKIDDISSRMDSDGPRNERRFSVERQAMFPVIDNDGHSLGFCRLDLNFSIKVRHLVAYVALANGEVGDARLVPRLQAHRSPDSAGHKSRSP